MELARLASGDRGVITSELGKLTESLQRFAGVEQQWSSYSRFLTNGSLGTVIVGVNIYLLA